MADRLPEFTDIEAAAAAGGAVVLQTPAFPSHSFSELTGREVWLKAENLQRAGSFKIRGAMNALSRLDEDGRRAGVVAASAGNHAQGVALAAQHFGIPATIFMPETAAIPKILATQGYGADVRLHGPTMAEAVDAAVELAGAGDAVFIHPYDHPCIVAGQGTLGLELAHQIPQPEAVVIPIGGGGLIAGTALALRTLWPGVVIVGVEADPMPLYSTSRHAGTPTRIPAAPTVADGIAIAVPSEICYCLIEAHVDELVTVPDADTTRAVALLLERSKLLVEPAGAVGIAALLDGVIPGDGPVAVVLSGGNIDPLFLNQVLRQGLEAAGRFGAFRVRVPDVPGQLSRVVNAIGATGANVLSVEHRREGIGLPLGVVEIGFTVAARSRPHFAAVLEALADYDVAVELQGEGTGAAG
jgi:threonine dehydratase